MFSRFYPPHPLLKEFVNSIIILKEDFDKTKPRPLGFFPPVPDHSLQFYPRQGVIEHKLNGTSITQSHSLIVPSCFERINLTMPYDYTIIRVGFHPGGLYRLLKVPMRFK